ncbi:hypothetical protein BN1723_015525, partial [Verticillium longisporum]
MLYLRSARARKLLDSPALQKQYLATAEKQKSLSQLGLGGQPADIDVRNRAANAATAAGVGAGIGAGAALGTPNGDGNGNLAQAVNDADAYFAGIGPQQMAAMRVDDGDVFGGNGGYETGYVVNQHAPQQVVRPAQGAGSNGDLLML